MFVVVFNQKACWVLSHTFSASMERILYFFYLDLSIQWIILLNFLILKLSLHPWNKSRLVIMSSILNELLNCLLVSLHKFSTLIFIIRSASSFSV